ncbi:MAG: chemotaxis protein CheD [Syntrophomonadaceae bacterium]|nr:chemotaxis protein CheD [Syntrophomonadaceae bacterium]
MANIIVGIGEMAVSRSPDDILKTFALGSCVAVILLAPQKKTVGLVHVALPDSKLNKALAAEKPGQFADTGIPNLLSKMVFHGCQNVAMVAKIAGGANFLNDGGIFKIGERNVQATKQILSRLNLNLISEDVGKNIGRTVYVDVNTGRIQILSPGRGEWEL